MSQHSKLMVMFSVQWLLVHSIINRYISMDLFTLILGLLEQLEIIGWVPGLHMWCELLSHAITCWVTVIDSKSSKTIYFTDISFRPALTACSFCIMKVLSNFITTTAWMKINSSAEFYNICVTGTCEYPYIHIFIGNHQSFAIILLLL